MGKSLPWISLNVKKEGLSLQKLELYSAAAGKSGTGSTPETAKSHLR